MPGNVLVVDDDVDSCRALMKLIQYQGHRATCVDSGPAALKSLADTVPDLVVLDQMMPGMDGLAVLRTLRADPRLAKLPVVMFSAVTDAAFQRYMIGEGANDYWVKGAVDYSKLSERLAPYLPA